MKTFQVTSTLGLALALGLALPASAQTVLLNDSFADGNRTGQNLTSSAAWYALGYTTSTSMTVDSQVGFTNGLAFPSGGSEVALAYFTNSGVQSLAVGQSITLTFDFRIGGLSPAANAIRVGLFNSNGGTRVSADNSSIAQGTGYTGYAVYAGTQASSNVAQFKEHAASDILGFSNYANVGSTSAFTAPAGGTIYTGNTFTITRTASGVDLSSTIAGTTITSSDTTGAITSFDTVALRFTNTGASYRIDNIEVSVSAIPEPSAFAALAGLGALGLAGLRRRRRA